MIRLTDEEWSREWAQLNRLPHAEPAFAPLTIKAVEARYRIVAARILYREYQAHKTKRRIPTMLPYNHKDVCAVLNELEYLKRKLERRRKTAFGQEVPLYLPAEESRYGKVNETVANLAGVIDWFKVLEELTSAKQGRKDRHLKWLVWQVGEVRRELTGKPLDQSDETLKYLEECCRDLELDIKIETARKFCINHPDRASKLRPRLITTEIVRGLGM